MSYDDFNTAGLPGDAAPIGGSWSGEVVATGPMIDPDYEKWAQGTLPVIELFGPTIQGEGPEAGMPCYFVRLGGCDYRCTWCDSMHAVDPGQVRANAEQLTAEQIADQLDALPGAPRWVILSGGNPALHKRAGALVHELHSRGYLVAVETQGSLWREWLGSVDRLVISPKPPSSGMATGPHLRGFGHFMEQAVRACSDRPLQPVLKMVVGHPEDLEWAKGIVGLYPCRTYLSVCTRQNRYSHDAEVQRAAMRTQVCDDYHWLCEAVARDPDLANVTVLPQLHVLAWGAKLGV